LIEPVIGERGQQAFAVAMDAEHGRVRCLPPTFAPAALWRRASVSNPGNEWHRLVCFRMFKITPAAHGLAMSTYPGRARQLPGIVRSVKGVLVCDQGSVLIVSRFKQRA
jgi:hypothetical protein